MSTSDEGHTSSAEPQDGEESQHKSEKEKDERKVKIGVSVAGVVVLALVALTAVLVFRRLQQRKTSKHQKIVNDVCASPKTDVSVVYSAVNKKPKVPSAPSQPSPVIYSTVAGRRDSPAGINQDFDTEPVEYANIKDSEHHVPIIYSDLMMNSPEEKRQKTRKYENNDRSPTGKSQEDECGVEYAAVK